jgi:uncharacterized protein YjbI with pentapeptide repeats
VEREKESNNVAVTDREARKRPWSSRLWEWTDFGDKTLWDWLQLLIVPLALAGIGFWFTAQQEARQQSIEEERAKAERKLEDQRAQDATLQAYLDQMSGLMLEENLRNSEEDSEVRTLARARTLTVLGRLGPDRKRSVIQFLSESSLIKKGNPVVDLATADLSDANLHLSNLSDADLSSVTLGGADLSTARLRDADLSSAGLTDADLSFADLRGATGVTTRSLDVHNVKLEGTIMPNGSKHD